MVRIIKCDKCKKGVEINKAYCYYTTRLEIRGCIINKFYSYDLCGCCVKKLIKGLK